MSGLRGRDDGFAMIAVIGAISIITVVAIGGYAISMNAIGESERVVAESRAFAVAESGLDRELNVFDPDNIDTGYYPRSGSNADGSFVVDVRRVGSAFADIGGEYAITSTGTSDEGEESVSLRFFYLDLWNMNIGAGENASLGGGNGWNGNASITGPLYIRGNLDWTANAAYEGGPLFIKDGALNVTGSGELGKAEPIKIYATNGITGKTGNVYPDGEVSSSVPDIKLPWIDDAYMDEKLDIAIRESIDNNMGSDTRSIVNIETDGSGAASSYDTALAPALSPRIRVKTVPAYSSKSYKYIGPSSGRSALGAGSNNVVIGTASFGAWEGHGYPIISGKHDDFAFDASTGTLYVEGTVFIDGDLTIGPGSWNHGSDNGIAYKGNGTLVVNGDVFITTRVFPMGSGLTAENCIGIVTPGDIRIEGYYHGAVFANGTVGLYHTATAFKGTILAGNIYGDKPNIHLDIDPSLPAALPQSMPAADGGIVFGGNWTRN